MAAVFGSDFGAAGFGSTGRAVVGAGGASGLSAAGPDDGGVVGIATGGDGDLAAVLGREGGGFMKSRT